VDRLIQVFTVLGFAIPGFIITVFLVRYFALGTHWFKPTGYVPITTSFAGWIRTVTFPVIALSIGLVAGVAQQVRSSVIDALRQDWVRTLRSRGVSERSVLFKHVLRNAGARPVRPGAVICRPARGRRDHRGGFGIPGLGQIAVLATSQGDVPLVMGLVVAIGVIVILVNLIIDLLQGFLNPKARIS
jgi:peptide/nickel transport system permease protein